MIEQFYENLLELNPNWKVKSVEQDKEKRIVTVNIAAVMEIYYCPECGLKSPLHDYSTRKVRHLDSCEYQTYLSVKYPRVDCVQCGTKAIIPPFAAENSRYTKAFESRIVELCKSTPVKIVARNMKLHWNAIYGIKDRAFKRGMAKQQQCKFKTEIKNLAIDEVSFRKHHDYVTVISDADTGHVLAVRPGRDAETLVSWFNSQRLYDFSGLQSISMDMAPPFIKAIRDVFSNSEKLICFDRFHVAQMFTKTVDVIRRRESAQLERMRRDNPLSGTRFEWLRNSTRTDNRRGKRRKFLEVTKSDLDTAKAWKLKELASVMWDYALEGVAKKAWKKLMWLLSHSRIPELKKLFKSVKEHLYGILNAIRLRANNAIAEARNSCIQRVKYSSCGYRNRDRFCQEILFQFGGLDLAF